MRNEKECVCSKIMSVCVCSKIIKELSGLVGSGTPCSSLSESVRTVADNFRQTEMDSEEKAFNK